jgi:hypothetical protein
MTKLSAATALCVFLSVATASFTALYTYATQYTRDQLGVAHVILAALTVTALQFQDAPYGKLSQPSARGLRGVTVDARVAWITMELPTLIGVALGFLRHGSAVVHPLTGMFVAHYVHRSLIYPTLQRQATPFPCIPWVLGMMYCSCNSFLQSMPLTTDEQNALSVSNLPLLAWCGIALFAASMASNIVHDRHLISLRKNSKPGHYVIPRGKLFDFISAPNIVSEVAEWWGYALCGVCAAGFPAGLPALSFALYTSSNLLPRAVASHKWYLAKFPEYTALERCAVIPYVW